MRSQSLLICRGHDHDLTCKGAQCSARKHKEQSSKYNYKEGVKIKIKNQWPSPIQLAIILRNKSVK